MNVLQQSFTLPEPKEEPFNPVCAHPGCKGVAMFGEGVRLRAGRPGTWWCREHFGARRAMTEEGKR